MGSQTVVGILVVLLGFYLMASMFVPSTTNLVLAFLFLGGVCYLIGPEIISGINPGVFVIFGYLCIPPVLWVWAQVCREYAGLLIGRLEEDIALVLALPPTLWLLVVMCVYD